MPTFALTSARIGRRTLLRSGFSNLSIGGNIRLWAKGGALAMALVVSIAWIGGDLQAREGTLYLTICANDGRLLAEEPVRLGQRVTIVYTHSVERVPVLEISQVRGEGPLVLTTLISRDALLAYPGYEQFYRQRVPWDGTSEGPLPQGLDMDEKDWFIVKGIERVRVMPLMVGGPSVDHRILVGAKAIRLGEVADPGEIVRIFVKAK